MSIENIEFFATLVAFVGFFLGLLWLGKRRDAARARAQLPKGTLVVGPREPAPAGLRLRIEAFDDGDAELEALLPLDCTRVRRIPGDDRPDYDLFRLETPIEWRGHTVRTLVIGPRMKGARFGPRLRSFPVTLAVAVNDAIETATHLDFEHARYVAVALVSTPD